MIVGILKGKSDGGAGGKRGHSNMDHWVTTSEIKDASRKRRRIEAEKVIAEEASNLPDSHGDDRL